MRWSRGAVPALVLCATATLTGCGTNDPTTAGAYDGGGTDGPTDHGTADSIRDLRPLGEPIELGGFLMQVDAKEVGSDKDGPWLVVTMQVENRGKTSLALPELALRCSDSSTFGTMVSSVSTVGPGKSVTTDVTLLVTNRDDDYFAPIAPCESSGSIAISVSSGRPDFTVSESDGWRVDQGTLSELNALLPFTRPGGEPKDPDRPYAWAAGDAAPEGYQVVSVPGMTASEALAVLDPLREVESPDAPRGVVVDDLDGGVVLFTHWLIPDRYVRELSRGGIAASYGNTVNGDDHVLVARDGKLVRSFDPFLDENFLATAPLPQEEGLDLEYDTEPAAWTLLERLTKLHITQDWLMDQEHPVYLLK